MAEISKHPKDAHLVAPNSIAVRSAIQALAGTNDVACAGAAIGACWQGPGRPRTRWRAQDPAQYGMDVFDELCERDGVTADDVWEAASRAFGVLIGKPIPTQEGVESALGNSDTATDGA